MELTVLVQVAGSAAETGRVGAGAGTSRQSWSSGDLEVVVRAFRCASEGRADVLIPIRIAPRYPPPAPHQFLSPKLIPPTASSRHTSPL